VLELTDAFKKIAAGEGSARAVIVTGEGRGFCSGANLAANPGGTPQGDGRPDAGAGLKAIYNPFVTMLREFDLPIVTAVNGAAAGVGCSLALMGDIIVAAESAYFLQAFRRIGLVPDGGSTYLLPRLIGKARAMEMALLGEKVPAQTALQWGLINRVVPDAELMSTARSIAEELARGPRAIGLIRKIMLSSLDADWSDALETEANTQTVAGRTDDFREGVAAFLQKRPAQFQGR
jgi:2-(1,2-epoxy-1,2-dihydrophenyl)acetyl-CoA isomerase